MRKSELNRIGARACAPLDVPAGSCVGTGDALRAALWETTTDVVLVVDEASTIIQVNPRCLPVLGYEAAQLVGRDVAMLMPQRMREAHEQGLARYLRTGTRTISWDLVEVIALRGDAVEMPAEVSFSEVLVGGERLFVCFLRDVSARVRQEARSQADREWAQATLRSIADAVVTLDLQGRIASLSVVAEHLTGWRLADAIGRPFEEVVRLRGDDGLPIAPMATGGHVAFDFPRHTMLVRRDEHAVPVEGTIAPILTATHEVAGSVAAFRNVAHARRLTAELSHQASHDGLTGLINRKAFERLLEGAIERAIELGDSDTLLYLDLDEFKQVNDTCGHLAGDALLQQLAVLLKARLRESDHLARLGGDEFGVLLHNCDQAAALQVAETLRKTVAEFAFVWRDKVFSIGVCIGVVQLGKGRLSLGELLGRADEACYVAKAKGRNAVHVSVPGDHMLALHHSEMEWTSEIRAAMAENRLFLCAQPIVRLRGGGPGHQEVLLRMRGRDGQTILPMVFLPAAERYGMMTTLDRWVLGQVLDHMAAQGSGHHEVFCINLSAASLCDPGFPAHAASMLADPKVDATRLCFEVSETTAVANLTEAARVMGELKALGVRFALDDFGSGMSSFAYLRQLPVDYLKIDGSFVDGIASQRVDRAMVESINHLAQVMGMRTIAEWVDNHQTLQILQDIGVDFAQGYGIERPQHFGDPATGATALPTA